MLSLSVRYRYDRPETQTLYLADLSFALKDYETAAALYKLVKDDFKADKSVLHYAQCLLNLSAALLLSDSHRGSGLREAQQLLVIQTWDKLNPHLSQTWDKLIKIIPGVT